MQSLLAADYSALIRYMPAILNQLIHLMAADGMSQDAEANCMKTLIHVVASIHDYGKEQLLKQYIKVCCRI